MPFKASQSREDPNLGSGLWAPPCTDKSEGAPEKWLILELGKKMFKIVWEHLVKAKARIVGNTTKVMPKGPRSIPVKDLASQGGETLSTRKIVTAMGRDTSVTLNLWFYEHIECLLSFLSLLLLVCCSSAHCRMPAHLLASESKERRAPNTSSKGSLQQPNIHPWALSPKSSTVSNTVTAEKQALYI